MLTMVEARTAAGTLLTLPLEDVSDGLIINNIDGLGPVKATVVTSSFASMDGVQFQSIRREARNIVIKLDLEPDYSSDSVQDLRDRLYAFFMSKMAISLRFIRSEGLEVDIDGYVESCEPDIFSQEPAVNISVICTNPDLIDITAVEIEGDTVADTTETLIDYPGTVETGIIFTMTLDRDLDELTIFHRAPDNTITSFELTAEMLTGDILTINTVAGSRSIILNRSSTLSSLLYGLSKQSKWTELTRGENYIRVYAVGDPIPYEITYLKRYGGL